MATVSIKQARTLYTTFEMLYEQDPCPYQYKLLAKKLGGIKNYGKTTPILITKGYELCGPWALGWALSKDCFRPLKLNTEIRLHLARGIDGSTKFYPDRGYGFSMDEWEKRGRDRQVAYFRRWFGK